MDIVKIRYTFRHKDSGNIEMKWYSIGQLEERAAAKLSPVFSDEYELISRDLYTGLKDKNGREIYEGDIVRNHRNNSNELLEVSWQEEVAQHASDGIYWTKEVPGFRFKRIKRGLTTVFVAHVDLEVIGNIYEDPELLEASHASE
ncbi:YopX family protein [Bacillus inaquosorum]|uniref:YopX family protein n=1 Tax=Bacillus inaquosorum TaxID=483913 RepID=UPI00227E1AE5|nr:YopX family protein [Bacillus inaquosorum]MCY8239164.1 YopX family protein [Bacillus inaquosorum]